VSGSPTFNGAIKGAIDADVGDFDQLQPATVMVLAERADERLDIGSPSADSAPDSVPGLEEGGGRVRGDVAVDARDEDQASSRHCWLPYLTVCVNGTTELRDRNPKSLPRHNSEVTTLVRPFVEAAQGTGNCHAPSQEKKPPQTAVGQLVFRSTFKTLEAGNFRLFSTSTTRIM
jgi:hypothetical protein